MPEEDLDMPDVGPALEEVRRDRVRQRVAGEEEVQGSVGACLPAPGRDDEHASVHVGQRHCFEASSWS